MYPNTATIDDSTPNAPPVKINDFDNNLYEKMACWLYKILIFYISSMIITFQIPWTIALDQIEPLSYTINEKIMPTLKIARTTSILFFTNLPEVHNNIPETTIGNKIEHKIQYLLPFLIYT